MGIESFFVCSLLILLDLGKSEKSGAKHIGQAGMCLSYFQPTRFTPVLKPRYYLGSILTAIRCPTPRNIYD
jgi:hypothetical protein